MASKNPIFFFSLKHSSDMSMSLRMHGIMCASFCASVFHLTLHLSADSWILLLKQPQSSMFARIAWYAQSPAALFNDPTFSSIPCRWLFVMAHWSIVACNICCDFLIFLDPVFLAALSALRVYQQPPSESTSHLQGLPATFRVYLQPSGSTSHLHGIPATSRV